MQLACSSTQLSPFFWRTLYRCSYIIYYRTSNILYAAILHVLQLRSCYIHHIHAPYYHYSTDITCMHVFFQHPASLQQSGSKLTMLEGECLGGCGVVVAQCSEHWQLKPGALGSIPGGCPDIFSSSMLFDVDGVMPSVVLQYSSAAITIEICMCMPVGSQLYYTMEGFLTVTDIPMSIKGSILSDVANDLHWMKSVGQGKIFICLHTILLYPLPDMCRKCEEMSCFSKHDMQEIFVLVQCLFAWWLVQKTTIFFSEVDLGMYVSLPHISLTTAQSIKVWWLMRNSSSCHSEYGSQLATLPSTAVDMYVSLLHSSLTTAHYAKAQQLAINSSSCHSGYYSCQSNRLLYSLCHIQVDVSDSVGVNKRKGVWYLVCLLYTSPSPRDATLSRMPSSA